ncbi:MAG: hypothetical protein K0S75_462 [Clostridia bacterium]|jgi:hypothetical protein|nr:hypothetical protein [Clostridia bacterium]
MKMSRWGKELVQISNDQIAHLKREFLNECPQHIKKQILKIEMPKSLKIF